jgi:hypothetical protein
MSTLSKDQAAQLRHAIKIAREGRATLAQLGAAHDLAAGAGLPGCAAELRAHVRALAADHHEPHRTAGRDVAMGVVSGIVTHVLLGGI